MDRTALDAGDVLGSSTLTNVQPRPLGGGRWELKAVIDDECRRGLERLKGLLSQE